MYGEEYPEKPSQPEAPVYPASSKTPEYPAYPEASKAPEYPAVPEYPKKPVEDVTSTIVQHVTLTKVPVAYTPAPYPTGPAPYVPVGVNSTSAYAPLPTGTGKPTKPTTYTPPEFEGAASRFGVGMTGIVAVVAGLLML